MSRKKIDNINVSDYEINNSAATANIVAVRNAAFNSVSKDLKGDSAGMTGFVAGTLSLPVIGSLIGLIAGKFVKSDTLRKAERQGNYLGAKAALNEALRTGGHSDAYIKALVKEAARRERTYQLGARRTGKEVLITSSFGAIAGGVGMTMVGLFVGVLAIPVAGPAGPILGVVVGGLLGSAAGGLIGAALGAIGSSIRTALHERGGRQAGEEAAKAFEKGVPLQNIFKGGVVEQKGASLAQEQQMQAQVMVAQKVSPAPLEVINGPAQRTKGQDLIVSGATSVDPKAKTDGQELDKASKQEAKLQKEDKKKHPQQETKAPAEEKKSHGFFSSKHPSKHAPKEPAEKAIAGGKSGTSPAVNM